MKMGYVYILTNINHKVLYTGVTSNLRQRLIRHQNELVDGFTKKYKLKYPVYYETFPSLYDAINREKQIKNWHRAWKLNLIKSVNPNLKDLSDNIIDAETSSA